MDINNCPSCGGKIEFSPKDDALKCVKCQKIFPVEHHKNVIKKSVYNDEEDEGYKEWEGSTRTFQCQNCGAKIVLNRFEMSTKCQYCNTSSLFPIDELPGLKPDGIIPFKVTKEEARKQFAQRVKRKLFISRKFVKNIPNLELGATYISSFDYSFYTYSTYFGEREVERHRTRTDGTTETFTEIRPFSGTKNHEFSDIVVETSDKLSQSEIAQILPYNYSEACRFDTGFLKGYSVGYYNQTVDTGLKRAKDIAHARLENMISSEYSRVVSLTVDTKFSNEKYAYLLLPLYFINYKYKDKDYLNIMNGQNGNVGGKFPISKLKVTLFSIFIGLIVLGIPLMVILITSILK